MTECQDDSEEKNYEVYMKSKTGEISIYTIQPELAETYENQMSTEITTFQENLQTLEVEDIKPFLKRERETTEEIKEDVKPKKRLGR